MELQEKKVFICGGGHQGLSMAAHLALNGVDISLWNRTEKNIDKIIRDKTIHCSGIVNGDASITSVSSNIEEVISNFIMVTTPSSAHKDIARYIAPYVNNEMIVILNPGRTFGAIEFAEELKKNGVKELPHIAETQTIVYTCRRVGDNRTSILAIKDDVKIASLNKFEVEYIYNKIPNCIREHFIPVESIAMTSLSNIGMILHCAPVLMNIGWIECEKADFKYYYDGISRSVAHFLEKLDNERIKIALAMGYKVDSLKEWIEKTYNVCGENLYECIRRNKAYEKIDAPPTINSRYIYEDIPNGLVPFESLGKELGIPTPNMTSIIELASSVMDKDFRTIGRKYSLSKIKEYL